MGLLFDKDGKMATIEQVRQLQENSDDALDILAVDKQEPNASLADVKQEAQKDFEYKSPAERMFADVSNSNWVAFGNKNAPVIYSFMDPQCSHCHSFMKDMRKKYLDQGLVQLRMIPVGFRDETLSQAAFLLASSDPAARWYRHLDGDKEALPVAKDTNTQGVQKNLSLMQAWKFDVTPMTVYRGKDGKVKIMRGRAQDMNKILADLPSVPAS
jgi:thiol:disulfide interchange protein DsbG